MTAARYSDHDPRPAHTSTFGPPPRRVCIRRGFTLVELLVVVVIIALLIGILVPVLGGVRDAAKKTATSALCTDVVNASAQFLVDKRRAPGHFPARSLSKVDASGPMEGGFTNAENVLLDLGGGIVREDTSQSAPPGIPTPSLDENDPSGGYTHVYVGPSTSVLQSLNLGSKVQVNLALVGTQKAGGGYLKIGADSLGRVEGEVGDNPINAESRGMYDLLDSFGMPLLIWTRDEEAGSQPEQFATIGIVDPASPEADEIGWYYWASHGAYLSSTGLGDKVTPQSAAAGQTPSEVVLKRLSCLDAENNATVTFGSVTIQKRAASLWGILGSPSFPTPTDSGDPAFGPFKPARSRGEIVVISAGPDRVYFARGQDPKLGAGDNATRNVVDYAPTRGGDTPTATDPSNPLANETAAFDDVVVAGGG